MYLNQTAVKFWRNDDFAEFYFDIITSVIGSMFFLTSVGIDDKPIKKTMEQIVNKIIDADCDESSVRDEILQLGKTIARHMKYKHELILGKLSEMRENPTSIIEPTWNPSEILGDDMNLLFQRVSR